MIRTIVGLFLIAHGLVHAGLAAAPIPNDPDPKPGMFFTATARSWLLARLRLNAAAVRRVGIVLVALTTLGFVVAGLGALGVPGLDAIWRTVAVVSACVSLLLLVLFWHTWLVVGILLDIAILIALLWAQWPSQTVIGS